MKDYPEVESILNDLGEILNDDIMIELNYKVDELQERPEDVAKEFLIEQGLID